MINALLKMICIVTSKELLQDILEESNWSGGLFCAYKEISSWPLKLSEIIEVEYYDVYNITFDYSDLKDIEREIRNNKLTIIQKDFSEKLAMI